MVFPLPSPLTGISDFLMDCTCLITVKYGLKQCSFYVFKQTYLVVICPPQFIGPYTNHTPYYIQCVTTNRSSFCMWRHPTLRMVSCDGPHRFCEMDAGTCAGYGSAVRGTTGYICRMCEMEHCCPNITAQVKPRWKESATWRNSCDSLDEDVNKRMKMSRTLRWPLYCVPR